MLEERIVELIHRDIDRDIDPPGRAELEARLESDPEARLLHEEMERVAAFLAEAPASEPPANFIANVMNSVRAGLPAQSAPRIAHATVVPFRRKYVALPLGIALAAAIVIAFIVAPSVFRSVDSSHLGGTMLEPRTTETISLTTAGGAVSVTERGESVVMTIEPAPTQRNAEVTFDARSIRVESIEGAMRSKSAPGRVEVTVQGSRAVVKFARISREPMSIVVRLHGDGVDAIDGRVDLPAVTNF